MWFVEKAEVRMGRTLGQGSFNDNQNYSQKVTWHAQDPCQLAYIDYHDFSKVMKRIQMDKENHVKSYMERIPFFNNVPPYILKQIVSKLDL